MTEEDERTRTLLQVCHEGAGMEELELPLGFQVSLYAETCDSASAQGEPSDLTHYLLVSILLPFDYPQKPPSTTLCTKSSGWTRADLLDLNQRFENDLKDRIDSTHQECLFPALEWLHQEWRDLVEVKKNKRRLLADQKCIKKSESITVRTWIYFHHIYSSKKRALITTFASQAKVTGFCLAGKPGIVCVEGQQDQVASFVLAVRGLSWQRMTVRLHEEIGASASTLLDHTKSTFEGFHHISLSLSEFRSYLEDHQCEEVFQVLFQL